MPVGGTGEFPSLLREEKREWSRQWRALQREKSPSSQEPPRGSHREATRSRPGAPGGADALIVTAPYYFKLSDASLIQHYTTVART